MNSNQKFDPPEKVVGPALTELMNRLARSRTVTSKNMGMSDEERKIFDYGVAERKRVLEHTLFLVFGQWALYRQVVSKLNSRAIRFSYAAGAFVSTSYFIGARARRVSHEMFSTIATTGMQSPLGNEARIVLAELEGPEGPYFTKICREKKFNEDITGFIVALDAKEGVDPTADALHPQLRLRPRLISPHPVTEVGASEEKSGKRAAIYRQTQLRPGETENNKSITDVPIRVGKQRGKDLEESQRPLNSGPAPFPRPNYEGTRGNYPTDSRLYGRKTETEQRNSWESNRTQSTSRDDEEILSDDVFRNPFDFARAAKGSSEDDSDYFLHNEGTQIPHDVNGEEEAQMTPSQRRAAERRMKRMRARQRDSQSEATDGYRK